MWLETEARRAQVLIEELRHQGGNGAKGDELDEQVRAILQKFRNRHLRSPAEPQGTARSNIQRMVSPSSVAETRLTSAPTRSRARSPHALPT